MGTTTERVPAVFERSGATHRIRVIVESTTGLHGDAGFAVLGHHA
jgi:hypothetical protein